MWSVVQYRRIGNRVKRDWQRQRHQNGDRYGEIKLLDAESRSRWRDVESNAQHTSEESSTETESNRAPTSLEKHVHPESEHNEIDGSTDTGKKIVVRLQGDADPLDPRNWSLAARCKNIAILSFLIFSQGWASGADSMANTRMSEAYGVSKVAANLSQAMYLLGIGSGCLFCGPLSETVGRNPVYLGSTFCYLCFVLGCAFTSNLGSRIVCRYFVGLFASAALGINGASVSDQFRPVKRAFAFPIIAWANVAAPMLAPVAGGWLVQDPRRSWHWPDWVTLIISGVAFIVALLFLPETYLPVLLDWKAKHLRRVATASGVSCARHAYVSEHAEKASLAQRLRHTLPMPVMYFKNEPVVAVLGSYLILIYILLFSFLSGFDYIFTQTYGLSHGLTGSCFASIAAGSTVFTLSAPALFRWSREETDHVRHAPVRPEYRLWPAIVTSPLLPLSLFWLGWTDYATVSVWSGLAACFCFGVVAAALYVSSYEYIVDSYTEHSAVALASITMARYLIAGTMVVAARPMYEGMGVHWTMTLLGCLALPLTPAPLFLKWYGEKLRARSPLAESP
ncbi:MFS transporter [Cladophialophora carrionii]|uniref:MFS transporter n=1 Tax=Cladophialophora carrionii TaxID=86049 RepID=A0A1C1D0H0_9EURO|nr:MFS transporter [Cladophialophora carrionii]